MSFATARWGESKVDLMIVAEFLFLLIDKLTKGVIPPRFVLFAGVGGIGLVLHLIAFQLCVAADLSFNASQVIATIAAMTLNYVINNNFTYRSQRLKGGRFWVGYLVFCIVCTVGGIANIGVADMVLTGWGNWAIAGIAGALMSLVFNFGAASQLVWSERRHRRRPRRDTTAPIA